MFKDLHISIIPVLHVGSGSISTVECDDLSIGWLGWDHWKPFVLEVKAEETGIEKLQRGLFVWRNLKISCLIKFKIQNFSILKFKILLNFARKKCTFWQKNPMGVSEFQLKRFQT